MGKHRPWNCPSFFKVMIGPDFPNTVRIPPHFKKQLTGGLPERAVLRRPGSRQWAVAIGRADGDYYFQQGWEAFIAGNSVSAGEFLVFFYVGDSVFDVVIYGTSGCERVDLVPLREVKVELEMAIEKIDDRENVSVPKKRIRKRNEKKKSVKKRAPPPAPVRRRKRRRTDTGKNNLCFKVMRARETTGGEDDKVIKAACAFKTIHPHFIVACRPSRSTFMPIPAELDRLFNLSEKPSIVLRDVQGRSWPIKISSWRDGRRCLSSCWSLVYKNNGLKEGDVCLLEFVQDGCEINLHIFRAEEYKEKLPSGKRLLTNAEKERALKEANSFKTKHSKFVAVWRSSLAYHVNIPQKIVKELDLKNNRHAIVLDPNGRSWPVEISCRAHGQVDLGSGWNNFVKENDLDIGAACVFEFARGGEVIQVKVHIFQGRETNPNVVANTSPAIKFPEPSSTAITILDQSPDSKSEIITF